MPAASARHPHSLRPVVNTLCAAHGSRLPPQVPNGSCPACPRRRTTCVSPTATAARCCSRAPSPRRAQPARWGSSWGTGTGGLLLGKQLAAQLSTICSFVVRQICCVGCVKSGCHHHGGRHRRGGAFVDKVHCALKGRRTAACWLLMVAQCPGYRQLDSVDCQAGSEPACSLSTISCATTACLAGCA